MASLETPFQAVQPQVGSNKHGAAWDNPVGAASPQRPGAHGGREGAPQVPPCSCGSAAPFPTLWEQLCALSAPSPRVVCVEIPPFTEASDRGSQLGDLFWQPQGCSLLGGGCWGVTTGELQHLFGVNLDLFPKALIFSPSKLKRDGNHLVRAETSSLPRCRAEPWGGRSGAVDDARVKSWTHSKGPFHPNPQQEARTW